MGTNNWAFNNNCFYNNICYNNTIEYQFPNNDHWQIFICAGAKTKTMNYIYNNVILGGEMGIVLFYNSDSIYNIYATIKNNIIRGASKCNIYLKNAGLTNWVSDHNCHGNNFWIEGYDKTLSQWKAETGQDVHSFVANPKFTNIGGNNPDDYKLRPSSPCLHAGANVGLLYDFFNNIWNSTP